MESSANNSNVQINVTGWKYIHEGNMGGAIIKMYRNKENGYIHSQSTFTSLGSGTSTFNNMFPSQLIPAMSVTLPLIVIDINAPSAKATNFGVMYPLKNP